MIKIECQLLPGDYVRAQYVHMRPSMLFVWLGWLLAALYPFFLAMMISVALRTGGWTTVMLISFIGLWLILYWLVFLPRAARKIFRQQKTLHEPCVMEIDAEGMVATSSIGHANLKWKDFTKYKRGKGMILVYHSDALFQMFPIRWFTDDQYESFKGYLRESLGKPS